MDPQQKYQEEGVTPLYEEKPSSKHLTMLLFIALPFVGFLLGMQLNFPESTVVDINQNVSKQVKEVKNTSDAVSIVDSPSSGVEYRNHDYGFSFTIPSVWSDIGFTVVNKVGRDEGQRVFEFVLQGINPEDHSTASFNGSIISVYPISNYMPRECGDEPLCLPGKEIGRNNRYVFVSEYFSPEAASACYDPVDSRLGGSFYELNKKLCEEGLSIRSIEREGQESFSTFDIN